MYVILLLIMLFAGADKPVKKQNPSDTKHESTQTKKSPPTSSATPSPSIQTPDSHQNGDGNSKPSDDRVYKVEVEQTPPDYWMRAYVVINLFVAAAAVASLFLIKHQRDVMKDQLQAMRDQINATQDSIDLQKTHLRQWVDVKNWGGGNVLTTGDNRRWLETYFDIVNPTSNPLTLKRIRVTVKGERSDQSFQHLLTPQSKYSSEWIIQLTPKEAQDFVPPTGNAPLVFRVTMEITFTDVLNTEQVQPFRFLALYRYGSPVRIDTKWG